ncbi:hypothetical protein KQ910_12040 [Reyranella sp. MMS21-HV4-11]|jgi:hypothetical protein|uniref:Prolyl 4-hydroxylase alpha subunit domain-containing protein n=1 Tax=Reyranella humidisoli TaxID=2849149 RepID=A0ABS6IJ90_9HYPH|nr:hypothetical protein [Reyranella sp. MMS21-HV4-11]MBU8874495.1 hypothetical protein [Reyranella sp. MMS21-HV4-11]
MRSNGIPVEFEDLLSRAGRRVLAGTHPLCGALANPRTRFLSSEDLLDRAKVARLRRTLEAELPDTLEPIEKPIPPDTIFDMKRDYGELLPKSSRARTIYFESRREPGYKAAERIGLVKMMRSPSFRAFAEALAGRKLASGWGMQVLRYGPGDYAGPHNDHHPENDKAKGGYIDLHLSLCGPGIDHQWLVYSRAGHFSEIVSVASPATVTAYRLPFWHYTTPLVGTPKAGRWVLLGTFLYR